MNFYKKDKTKKLPLQEIRINYTNRGKKQFLLVKSEMASYDRIVTQPSAQPSSTVLFSGT